MESAQQQRRHSLSVLDMVSLIIGIVVGTGIFETPRLVFQNVSSPTMGMAVWVVAGLLCLIGALCYAELASTYQRTGGDYVYLTHAYGPAAGFLFAWAQLAVILPANIGMMAFVFSEYAQKFWDFPHASWIYALAAVGALSLLNVLGFVFGRRTQNVLTTAKVAGLALIIVAGFVWSAPAAESTGGGGGGLSAFAFAMVLAFFTYGGWNDAAYVAAEMRDGRRNIPLALTLGTGSIIVLYLLVNGAYLSSLGLEGVRNSKAVAAVVLEQPFGVVGGQAISVLVMISALGTVNGLIFTGSRIYSTLGEDYGLFAAWGRWHPRLGAPVAALVSQAAISLGLIVLVGTSKGRALIDRPLTRLGLDSPDWGSHGGFELLLKCTAPLFWVFFLLTGVSLFVLRFRHPERPRPFSVPLYPVIPLIFCANCAYMVYSGVLYARELGLVGGVLLLVGVPLYLVAGRRTTDMFAAMNASHQAMSSET